jgi:hypothetical protein
MIPLYGFLQGDTIGLLVLAYPADTAADLCAKLQGAAALRVRPLDNPQVRYGGRILPTTTTVADANMAPLDRFDVVAGPLQE